MARKKTQKKVVKKRAKETVAKIFDCPLCCHTKTVVCKIVTKDQRASLECRVCSSAFETKAGYLTAPIDVYTEWIDEMRKTGDKVDDDDGVGGEDEDMEDEG